MPPSADPIKETTYEAIQMLKREGINVVMPTGDNRTTAEAASRQLGITEVKAEVPGTEILSHKRTSGPRPVCRNGR